MFRVCSVERNPEVFFGASVKKKLLCTILIVQLSISRIAVNAKLRFGVFMLKMNPNDCGLESPSSFLIIFQIKCTRSKKQMLKSVKSTASNIVLWSRVERIFEITRLAKTPES
jgi:hypothetical protein